MSRATTLLIPLLAAAWSFAWIEPARAQDAPPPPPAPAEGLLAVPAPVIVEAGTPIPVPLEGVAERLRVELPSVPVQVGAPGAGSPGAAATVTLGLTAAGELHVVYRDAAGREATRIVADTHDPQAVAAAIAMVVANLHRSQVDLALAAIGPQAPAPVVIVPAAPAPSPAPAPPAAPAAPPIVQNQPTAPPAPAAPPAPPARPATTAHVVQVVAPAQSRWSASLAPIAALVPEQPVYGADLSVEWAVTPAYRLEASLGTTAPMDTFRMRADGTDVSGTYSHTVGALRARRLFPVGSRLEFGAAAGLGFIISVHDGMVEYDPSRDPDLQDEYLGSRSDLDFVATAGGSLDVRLIGQTVFWTTHLDLMLTTGGDSYFRPFGPGIFMQAGTGVRIGL